MLRGWTLTWEKKFSYMNVWYDEGWSRGMPMYSSYMKLVRNGSGAASEAPGGYGFGTLECIPY